MTQPNFDNYLKETIHSCKCIQPESELYNDEKYSLFKEKVVQSIKQDRVANRKVLFFSVVTIFVISLLLLTTNRLLGKIRIRKIFVSRLYSLMTVFFIDKIWRKVCLTKC